ncbi:MAG: hypothetical protein QOH03_127 [Kribbellaceae bacterium]|nr:hypothetical protein [Kribbellaceae bacterium]
MSYHGLASTAGALRNNEPLARLRAWVIGIEPDGGRLCGLRSRAAVSRYDRPGRIGIRDLPNVSATLENEAIATLENEATQTD